MGKIVYKYYSKEAFLNFMIKSPTLKYSNPLGFNDPFEVFSSRVSNVSDNKVEFYNLRRLYAVSEFYKVICFTRSPLNSLMWAHYAGSHEGVVLGFDAGLAGFFNKEKNVLPLQFGSMIYTESVPQWEYENSELQSFISGDVECFDYANVELLQRLFLYKSVEWSYEEEVRLVVNGRCINGQVGCDGDLLVDLDARFVRELYFGSRFFSGKDLPSAYLMLCRQIVELYPHAKFWFVQRVPDTWRLEAISSEDSFLPYFRHVARG